MGSTRDPHPTGYLAFGCFIYDLFAYFEREIPSYPMTYSWRDGANPCERAVLRWGDANARAHASVVIREAAGVLSRAGVPREQLDNPRWAEYFALRLRERSTAGRLAWELERQRTPAAPPKDGPYRPSREAWATIIVGTYFTTGGLNGATTAAILNRGIPRMNADRCVAQYHVRNALHTFAQMSWRRISGSLGAEKDEILRTALCEIVRFAAIHAAVTNCMWERLKGDTRFRSAPPWEACDRLLQSGELFDWHREALNEMPPITISDAAVLRLLHYGISMLKYWQRKRAA